MPDGFVTPKGCYLVPRECEKELHELLLRSGMAQLIPEEDIARGPRGELLLAGMFVVEHTRDRDRLIVDRRPANALEHRLRWARLPMGSQLGRLVVNRRQAVRGAGDSADALWPAALPAAGGIADAPCHNFWNYPP